MAKRRKPVKKGAVGRPASERLRETWKAAVAAVSSAEHEVGKQVKRLLERNRFDARQAKALLRELSARVDEQRAKAGKRLEARAKQLQSRLKRERRNVARMVDDAVKNALAAFNIPSRQEVAELTRKVDALSKKIDKLRR